MNREAVQDSPSLSRDAALVSAKRGNLANETSRSQQAGVADGPTYRRSLSSRWTTINGKLRLATLDAMFAEMDSEP
ncbi:MAG: hypothetical protein NTY15_21105 [Planctomycetota bacterium]|nr:hypothetical protein [Planctomycetota bacterium]